jgi:hypothetical protein
MGFFWISHKHIDWRSTGRRRRARYSISVSDLESLVNFFSEWNLWVVHTRDEKQQRHKLLVISKERKSLDINITLTLFTTVCPKYIYDRFFFRENIHWFLLRFIIGCVSFVAAVQVSLFFPFLPAQDIKASSIPKTEKSQDWQKNFSDFLILLTPIERLCCYFTWEILFIFNWADLIKTHSWVVREIGTGRRKNYFVSLITHEIFISHHIKILANCKSITEQKFLVLTSFLSVCLSHSLTLSKHQMLSTCTHKMCSAFCRFHSFISAASKAIEIAIFYPHRSPRFKNECVYGFIGK